MLATFEYQVDRKMILRGQHHLGSDLYPSSTHQFLPLIAPFIFFFSDDNFVYLFWTKELDSKKKKKNWRKQGEYLGVRAAKNGVLQRFRGNRKGHGFIMIIIHFTVHFVFILICFRFFFFFSKFLSLFLFYQIQAV